MTVSKEQMLDSLSLRCGKETAHKLVSARIAVCGLGGLGSNIATALCRAGVGNLHIIDFDKVDISNINRQQYSISQIGMYKTDAMAMNLYEISPFCHVRADTVRLDEINIPKFLSDDDIIIEALDDASAKALLVNTILEKFPFKKLIAASGMAGLGSANDIITRRVTSSLYICGDAKNEVSPSSPLYASRVMLCAAHQAHMALRIICGETQP
ncbi:MAG: sulfur carrier protein ThiS adenylyltransferase ThiF [Clostridia bacterium]|nr:sulfur carrier protein ThiS adenylyltransferase ThiF [Clostridia bacterium]